jgi:hypothetical protein
MTITALSIRQFLAKHPIPVLPQPFYLPDLSSPPDYFQYKNDPERKISDGRGHDSNTTDEPESDSTNFIELCFQCGKGYGRRALLLKK